MNSGLSDFKAHILISLSGKKEITKAQEQEILPERTRLNGASKQEARDGRGRCVLWESATRMGDGLKGPKEIPLCSGPNMALEIGAVPLKSCGGGM